jgi:hypothetical protein
MKRLQDLVCFLRAKRRIASLNVGANNFISNIQLVAGLTLKSSIQTILPQGNKSPYHWHRHAPVGRVAPLQAG